MRIWDLATGTTRHTLPGHTGGVSAMVAAPDGSWLASAGHDWFVRIWDLATGTTRHTLPGHTGGVSAMVAAPDGSWLASADRSGVVRIWDPATGTTRHTLPGPRMSAIVVAPDGSWLASADRGSEEVRIWDLATGTTRHTLPGHTGGVSAMAVAPDGSWLASADDDGEVRIWDPTAGAATHVAACGGPLVPPPRSVHDDRRRRRPWSLLPDALPWDPIHIGTMASGTARRSLPKQGPLPGHPRPRGHGATGLAAICGTDHRRPPVRPARARPKAARSKRDRPGGQASKTIDSATYAPPEAARLNPLRAYSATPRLNTTRFNDVLYCSQGLCSAVALERSVPCIRRGGARLLATIGSPRTGFYPTQFG